jgi:hypothetical protein
MESNEKIRMLQTIYAGAMADHVLRLGNEGVLEKVTAQKKAEQMYTGKGRATQMGITRIDEVFTRLSDIMGCADWQVSVSDDGSEYTAVASRCMLCSFAKRMGTQSPCQIACLDPMAGMVHGLAENAAYHVESTLFDGPGCKVLVSTK